MASASKLQQLMQQELGGLVVNISRVQWSSFLSYPLLLPLWATATAQKGSKETSEPL